MIRKILSWRIFWYCEVGDSADGYWYHCWTNVFVGETTPVFAGYNKRALNKKSTTFRTAQERFLAGDEWTQKVKNEREGK